MRLVAITRIFNEDDIVEAFVRHHAAQVDHHLFLDNGSVDRTLEILGALFLEGVKLTVMQNTAAHYAEETYNTNLFEIAVADYGADWVVFLDTDEFLDPRAAPGGLRGVLAEQPDSVDCVTLRSINYYDTQCDDANDPLVPRRVRRRERVAENPAARIVVRASLARTGVRISPGNHLVLRAGAVLPAAETAAPRVAHYPRRDPWQQITKSVIGRLKVLAAGRGVSEGGFSFHYNEMFTTMRDRPESLLRDPAFLHRTHPHPDLVDDPIDYLGTPLLHTFPGDPVMKAIRVVLGYGELLALQHGRMIDTNEGMRLQTTHDASAWQPLF